MKVIPFIYNDEDDLIANTYIVIDNNECVVIDPSKAYEGIAQYIKKNNLILMEQKLNMVNQMIE